MTQTGTEASTIMGMTKSWFLLTVMILLLNVAGFVAAGVLCLLKQRVVTPNHAHNNTHNNVQPHLPFNFPCESHTLMFHCCEVFFFLFVTHTHVFVCVCVCAFVSFVVVVFLQKSFS